MTIRSFWPLCAFIASASIAQPLPPRPVWEPKVYVDAYYYFDLKNSEHRRASPYGGYWKQVFDGQQGAPAEILIVRETWDMDPTERDSAGYQPPTETYSVLVHLRAYGERIKIEAAESAPARVRNRAMTVQRVILRVASNAEQHLKKLRQKHSEQEDAGSGTSTR